MALLKKLRDKAAAIFSPTKRRKGEEEERELALYRPNFDRLFAEPFDRCGWNLGRPAARSWMPVVDVAENSGEIVVRVEAPGLDAEDLDVSVTEHGVTVRGDKRSEREENNGQYYRLERSYGSFNRFVPLPSGVDPEGALARCKHGVLTVRVPRLKPTSARRIQIAA
jgi:HSP20 family protein